MSTAVKYLRSSMTGAPVLANNWGDLVALLDACLVNGFNLKTVTSITRSGTTATVTVSSGHGFEDDQVVLIEGAAQAEYNGEKRITVTGANTFTFEVTGSPATPATGTITAKTAPLGWVKAFFGTHKAAYRSANPASPQHLLRVDNSLRRGYTTSWAKFACVAIVEAGGMTDIDTITGQQAPFDASAPNRNWVVSGGNTGWHKWYHAVSNIGSESNGDGGSGAREWIVIGDDRLFYLLVRFFANQTSYGRALYAFGDIESFRPADGWHTLLVADDTPTGSFSNPNRRNGFGFARKLDFDGKCLLRPHTQLGSYIRCAPSTLQVGTTAQEISGSSFGALAFPHGPDYNLWLLPVYLREETPIAFRGFAPGCFWVPHDRPYSDLSVVNNVVGLSGRRVLLPRLTNEFVSPIVDSSCLGFDITGPWR